MRRPRMMAVVAALLMTVGFGVAGAAPAQAASPPAGVHLFPLTKAMTTQYGCPDNYGCVYDHYAYNYNWDGPPDHAIPIQTLIDAGYNNGRNLANWGFDNRTTCAMNNSRSGTGYKWLWFNQFNDQTGFYWQLPAGMGACWDGWWRDNRATRIGVRPR
jgi:hypothetical protein